PCFTAVRAEIALMSGSAFAVTHHPVSSRTGGTADRNRSHWSTSKTPSYTKSVSWQHHRHIAINILTNDKVFKAGLRRKMRKAAMDRNYLASVLEGSGLS
ncbi:hypothetical protein AW002_22510, partial [Shigella sonnei]